MTATQKIELLAPGGDIEAIKAAIVAGANAVYCGLDNFNARNRAKNLTFDDLTGILRLAHKHNCQVFLTINVVILEQEIASLLEVEFVGNPDFLITGINEIHVVEKGDIVFVDHPKYYDKALNSAATTILINKKVKITGTRCFSSALTFGKYCEFRKAILDEKKQNDY